jgi:DNA-binding response OmpR family regulator
MTPQIEDLQEQVRYLRGRIEELTGTEDQITRLRSALGLRPKHAAVLALMLNTNRSLSVDAIYRNVFEYDNGDGPIIECVKVAICEIRKHIIPLGAPERCIPAAFGTGTYSLTPEARAWLTSRIEPMEIAA